jgi:hypothetical protein
MKSRVGGSRMQAGKRAGARLPSSVSSASAREQSRRAAVGQIIAGATVEPNPVAILAGDDPEAIVLDLMQPPLAGRRLLGFGRQARLDEPGRQGTRTRQHGARDSLLFESVKFSWA